MLDFRSLPASRGTYVLHLLVPHPQSLMIGRLGQYNLPVGHYFYTWAALAEPGACGPAWGGICAAVARGTGTSTICAPCPRCKPSSTR